MPRRKIKQRWCLGSVEREVRISDRIVRKGLIGNETSVRKLKAMVGGKPPAAVAESCGDRWAE